MGWTKGEILTDVFTELGIANYAFDIGPEETTSALRRLDTMMAAWEARGLRLSYPLPSGPDCSSVDEDSNIPSMALDAVITNLAARIAPSYGKAVSAETKQVARKELTTLYGIFAKPDEQQFNRMPLGAGYKQVREVFTPAPEDRLAMGDDAGLDLEGALNNVIDYK